MEEERNTMYTFKEDISQREYNEFIENYSAASILQEYNWANVKSNWGNFHVGLYKDDTLVAVALILVRTFKGVKIFYVPRGYLIDFTNKSDLAEMTKHIKLLARKNKAFMVRIDPNFCAQQYTFKRKEAVDHYTKDYIIKDANLKALGYKKIPTAKEMGHNWQPEFNILAPCCNKDLELLTVDEILGTYKSKFKYYIGAFHEKRGVSFEITQDKSRLKDFVNILKETEQRQNIRLRNEEYFDTLMESYKNAYLVFGTIDLNAYIDFLKGNNGKEEEINNALRLREEKGEKMILSASLMVLPSNKKGIRTSEYLYAGNSSELMKLRASTGLVFEIIKFSCENKCHYCNLGGVDGNLNDHLTMFKEKFNGQVLEFAGEYDLVINKPLYFMFNKAMPLLRKMLH